MCVFALCKIWVTGWENQEFHDIICRMPLGNLLKKKKSWGELRGRREKNPILGQTFPPFSTETAGIKQTTEESSRSANLYFSVKSLKKLWHYGSVLKSICSLLG